MLANPPVKQIPRQKYLPFLQAHPVNLSWLLALLTTFFSVGVFALEQEAIQNTASSANQESCTPIETNKITATKRFDRELASRYAGYPIGSITISVLDIFDESDPDEDAALFRLANRIQVNTKHYVVKKRLLFKEGDPINVKKIDESLRILYQQSYLLESKIIFKAVCEGKIHLHVSVRDAWVLEPKISFGRKGGENSSAVGFIDGNFLGTGNEVALIYESEPDRNKIIYRVRTSHIFNMFDAEIYHADLSDGEDNRLSFAKPFYSLNTPWSFGASTTKLTQKHNTRFNDEVLNQFNVEDTHDLAFVGHTFNIKPTHVNRLYLGYTESATEFITTTGTVSTPEATKQEYPWIEFEKLTNRFERFNNLTFIARTESVPIGANYRLRFGEGKNLEDETFRKIEGEISNTVSVSKNHLFRFKARLDIQHTESNEYKDSLLHLRTMYYGFIDNKNRWYVKASYDEGRSLSEHLQLTVGELQDVRGYPLAYQRGNKRYIVNIERRYYSDAHWFNLIRVGAVAFADFGHVWGDETFEDNSHLKSVGLGLRFNSSKSGNPAVVHLNIAAPLTDQESLDDYLFSLSVETAF